MNRLNDRNQNRLRRWVDAAYKRGALGKGGEMPRIQDAAERASDELGIRVTKSNISRLTTTGRGNGQARHPDIEWSLRARSERHEDVAPTHVVQAKSSTSHKDEKADDNSLRSDLALSAAMLLVRIGELEEDVAELREDLANACFREASVATVLHRVARDLYADRDGNFPDNLADHVASIASVDFGDTDDALAAARKA